MPSLLRMAARLVGVIFLAHHASADLVGGLPEILYSNQSAYGRELFTRGFDDSVRLISDARPPAPTIKLAADWSTRR
jgi:hypothetical protein